MKLPSKILALLLAAGMALSLASCADSGAAVSPSPDASPSAAPSADPSAAPTEDLSDVDTSVADLCLATAGIPGDFELLTVNGAGVNAYTYLYLLNSSISYFEQAAAYFGQDLIWEDEITEGVSLSEFVKQDARNAVVYYSILAGKAKELGLELTPEQTAELDANMAAVVEDLGGEEAYQDQLRMTGLDHDSYYALQKLSYYYELLREKLYPEESLDEEIADYVERNDILYAKHILLMTVDPTTREPLDEETVAQKRSTAEDLLSQLRAAEGEAQLTLFDELMNEYSEDTGLASNPDGYTFTAGDMVPEFEEGTRALAYGEISGIVESEYGYHIILRLDPRAVLSAEELLDEQLDTWVGEADVTWTDEYQNLDAQTFYENRSRYQQAFAAQFQAENSAGDESGEGAGASEPGTEDPG